MESKRQDLTVEGSDFVVGIVTIILISQKKKNKPSNHIIKPL
jgi:hypothetical protein